MSSASCPGAELTSDRMTPIERISRRSKALEVLGLDGNPTKTEVRRVFRKLAFERHPDHGNGSPEEFAQISDAYRFLSETAVDDVQPKQPRTPKPTMSRPAVQAIETEFSEATLDQCEAMLGTPDETCTRHITTRLYRKGRMLTYFVPSAPAKGLNRIAIPTGELIDSRRMDVQVIDIWSGDIAGQTYDVPAQTCARVFPGARSVQIRFGTVTRH